MAPTDDAAADIAAAPTVTSDDGDTVVVSHSNVEATPNRAEQDFPAVQGGGSLMIAWQIKGKHVLVIGGGEVAAGRIVHCLNADAHVTVVCPSSGLNPEVAYRIACGQVRHIDRTFEPSDLVLEPSRPSTPETMIPPPSPSFASADSRLASSATSPSPPGTATPTPPRPPPPETLVDMVLVAIDDPEASTSIWKMCRERRVIANIADVPSECDFYFGSVHRDGPLQVMVSTNGNGPRLAAQIRRWIGSMLPGGVGGAIERVGKLRGMLRNIAPTPEEGPKRMKWMSQVSDAYTWQDMCDLEDEDMENLLLFWPKGTVPSLEELKALRPQKRPLAALGDMLDDLFDGSFGFAVGV